MRQFCDSSMIFEKNLDQVATRGSKIIKYFFVLIILDKYNLKIFYNNIEKKFGT